MKNDKQKFKDNIDEFKRNYHRNFYEILVPALKGYERERKKTLFWAIFWTVILNTLGIWYLYFIKVNHIEGRRVEEPGVYLIVFGIMMYWIMKKGFESKIKEKIMGPICKCFGNMSWSQSYLTFDAERFVEAGLFRNFDSFDVDDAFVGTYKDCDIDIVEAEFTVGSGKNRSTVFNGLLIKLDMNKNFKGHTLLTENTFFHKSPLAHLRHTELEDVMFEKKYDVFTDDEVEARYILTSKLMDKLVKVKMAFRSKSIRCAFLKGQFLIAMENRFMQDLFSLGSLTRPVSDAKQFTLLCRQFISVISLIDHFELYQDAVL